MCYNCYHKAGRLKKAWLCPHSQKPHYALGKCHNCYQWTNNFKKQESKPEDIILDNSKNSKLVKIKNSLKNKKSVFLNNP
jgi:hypothetical protein